MELILLADGSRGIYIPQFFAQHFMEGENADLAGRQTLLEGPDHPEYWDTWADVVDNWECEFSGVMYTLHEDGDLWAVPPGYEWPEE